MNSTLKLEDTKAIYNAIRHAKYILAIAIALPLTSIYFLSMYIPMKFESQMLYAQKAYLSLTFYLGTVLLLLSLLVRDLNALLSELLMICTIIVLGLYSYGAGLLYDLNRFNVNHYVIPPFFIYMPCPDANQCDGFSVLAISIPLSIAMVMLVYGILGVLRACRA